MLKGIQDSAAFVLFLSQGVLARPYCQMEIRHAMALKKPIVLVHGEIERRMHAVSHSLTSPLTGAWLGSAACLARPLAWLVRSFARPLACSSARSVLGFRVGSFPTAGLRTWW